MPPSRLRRFVAVQHLHDEDWRPAVFVGWHLDPRIKPGPVSDFSTAQSRAKRYGESHGLTVITDRVADARGCVWDATA